MTFTITIDYRFDSAGFFDSPDRRLALEAAAGEWEAIIGDDFTDLPAGTAFDIRHPTTFSTVELVLTDTVDDLILYVGARDLPGSTLAVAGPDGENAAGDVYAARISSDFRGTGPVTDFEPWAGVITFDSESRWSFDPDGPGRGQNDFLSVAIHEIGHVLGIGTSGAFDRWVLGETFTGPNTSRLNAGIPVPIDDDLAHIEEGFAGNTVSLDPFLDTGTRILISDYDKAILADIGYDIASFEKQGTTPSIATESAERIFGRSVDDTLNGLGGDDSLQGAGGNDRLVGDLGHDDLFGQDGNDTLLGGAGNDYLDGGDGDDLLSGGPGSDTYFGKDGVDVFSIRPGDGWNKISDFDVTREVLRLIDSGFATPSDVVSAITKPFGNLSRITLHDGTQVDVFHAPQAGSPLSVANFDLVQSVAEPGGGFPEDEGLSETAPPQSVLVGTEGNDLLTATSAVSRIDGLDGEDTAFFGGDQGQYILSLSQGAITVTRRDSDGAKTIGLDNIERVAFDTGSSLFDGPIDLRLFAGHAGLSEEAFESVIEMYIAYFNRAPDAIGLSFWATAFAQGTQLEQIATLFAEQPETLRTYPAEANTVSFVADVYQNVLGRAPDMAGLLFWADALDEGSLSRSGFILDLLKGAKAAPSEEASQTFVDRQRADQLYLEQKTDLGALFAAHRGMSNTDNASAVMDLFDGSQESLVRAIKTIDELHDAALDPLNGEFLMPLIGILEEPFSA